MKITVEIDCTPEEARRAMGMPDTAVLQEAFLQRMMGIGGDALKPEAMEAMLKGWMPLSEAGMGMWRSLVEQGGAKPGGSR